ncbi:MAG: NAD(P)-dependent oxidoreductase [Paracoccus sp. (in: a-proteobacteria)]
MVKAKARVGMIGIGLMGHGIAHNILAHGWPLSYLRHTGNQPTEDLDAAGASGVDRATDLATECNILLLCVTGTPQVEDILTGSGGLLAALTPGMIIIDCSTAIPESTVAMARQVEAAGAHLVDAAMTRTPKEAREGRLNLLIGGAPNITEKIMPLLASFSENRFLAGPVGAGHRLKLLHNFVSLGAAALISEAASCARRAGIADDILIDCLRRGGGHGAALDRIAPYLLEGTTGQMRFTVDNGLKDMTYYNCMAREAGASHVIAEAVQDTMARMVKAGHGAAYLPEQVDLMD